MNNLPMLKLREVFGERLQEDVRMTSYTTTRVGGAVAGFISINSSREMEQALTTLWELDVPYHILGSGSNLLVSDSGYEGLILHNRSHNSNQHKRLSSFVWRKGARIGTTAQLAFRRGFSG